MKESTGSFEVSWEAKTAIKTKKTMIIRPTIPNFDFRYSLEVFLRPLK